MWRRYEIRHQLAKGTSHHSLSVNAELQPQAALTGKEVFSNVFNHSNSLEPPGHSLVGPHSFDDLNYTSFCTSVSFFSWDFKNVERLYQTLSFSPETSLSFNHNYSCFANQTWYNQKIQILTCWTNFWRTLKDNFQRTDFILTFQKESVQDNPQVFSWTQDS